MAARSRRAVSSARLWRRILSHGDRRRLAAIREASKPRPGTILTADRTRARFMRIILRNHPDDPIPICRNHLPRAGGDNRAKQSYGGDRVSIHAPARGATSIAAVNAVDRGFNPRPRAGGDLQQRRVARNSGVSIHAPARGATVEMLLHQPYGKVSIHAPARGATQCLNIKKNYVVFQSTPPRGGRR